MMKCANDRRHLLITLLAVVWIGTYGYAAQARADQDETVVVAFGDSGNDVELLKAVGLGVAMGNARAEAKKAAVVVIGPNDSDAIAEFIDRVVLFMTLQTR